MACICQERKCICCFPEHKPAPFATEIAAAPDTNNFAKCETAPCHALSTPCRSTTACTKNARRPTSDPRTAVEEPTVAETDPTSPGDFEFAAIARGSEGRGEIPAIDGSLSEEAFRICGRKQSELMGRTF